MKGLAAQAREANLSTQDRAILDAGFASLRADIDEIAQATEFKDIKILAGGEAVNAAVETATVTATTTASSNSNLTSAAGYESFTFSDDPAGILDEDRLWVEYEASSKIFTVTNTVTGEVVTAQGPASAPGAGAFTDVAVSAFGLTIKLNDAFDPNTDNLAAADNLALNELRVDTSDTSSSVQAIDARQFDYKVGTGGTAAEDDITVTLKAATVTSLNAALASAGLNSSAGATAVALDVDIAIGEVTRARDDIAALRERFNAAGLARDADQGILRKETVDIGKANQAELLAQALRELIAGELRDLLVPQLLRSGREVELLGNEPAASQTPAAAAA